MKRTSLFAAMILIGAAVWSLTSASASPLAPVVVMSGLDNPRGLAFAGGDDENGKGGTLYVAEAGRGGSGPCVAPRGVPECYGPTGAVSRLRDGKQQRIVTGLPSYAVQPSGEGATGPHDISVHDGKYVTLGLGLDPARRADFGSGGANFGKLVRLRDKGGWKAVADLAAYEAATNPGGGPPDSNPYGLASRGESLLVAEAGGNTLLRVGEHGRISTLAVLPSRAQGRDTDSVPTAVVRGPGGALYVGELTGGPFPEGGARIYRIARGGNPEVYLTGFTGIIDLAFARDGTLYVLQFANGAGLSGPGAVIRVEPNGSRSTALDGLVTPTSLVFGSDGSLYVTNFGVFAGAGEVLQVDVGEQRGGPEDD